MNTNNSHDSNETIFPADPRITAYAFGELEGDELKLIEAAVNADPALQAAVAELRGFGDTLSASLVDEPPALGDRDLASTVSRKKGFGRLIPFPLHYLATAMAACFAVVVWVRHEPNESTIAQPVPEEKVAAVAGTPTPVSELDHRMKVAKQVAAAPMASPVLEGRIFYTADNALQMSTTPDLPSVGASSLGDVSFGTGMAAEVKFDSPAGNGKDEDRAATRERLRAAALSAPATVKVTQGTRVPNFFSSASDSNISVTAGNVPEWREVPPVPAAALAVTLDVKYKFDHVLRDSNLATNAAVGGFFDQDRLNASNESYALPVDNVYRSVDAEPLSTFSIDVDTASYSNVRRFINGGRLPPRDAVRVEELINYFPYRYATPKGDVPFAANLAVASAPWAPEHRLVRIGIKGRELSAATRPAANLVFLLDVSGSMNSQNKLPLVKASLRMLVERLRPDDRVAIVTYAGSSGLALPSTPASKKNEILAALDNLKPGGSTNGAMGIHLAYDIAKANFVAGGGINRVILCTDGDFNVGVTDRGELTRLIEEKAKSRVFLSVFGFGMGNLKDATLESLSSKGNGTYGYIDSRREAEKVFIEQVEGTLATIAKDVKIQVEFNPACVASYRLIGYENRMLAKEDFNNDAVDAGDIGAGHTVTALYEVVPVGAESGGAVRPAVDPLKYQKSKTSRPAAPTGSKELLTVKIRYKQPEGDVSSKQEFPLVDGGASFAEADSEFRFATAVAAWGMLLRDSEHKGAATCDQVIAWAEDGLANDEGGHRAEFIQLVRKSAELTR
jgi:Ca-activated chloride channel homolog